MNNSTAQLNSIKQDLKINMPLHKQQWINQYQGMTTMNTLKSSLHPVDQAISDKVWSDHRALLSRKDSKKKTDFHIEYNDVDFDESKADASLELERQRTARTLGANKTIADNKREQDLAQHQAADNIAWITAKVITLLIIAAVVGVLIAVYKLIIGG